MTVAHLRQLPHVEYLKTEHWRTLRRAALDYYGDACLLCGKRSRAQVHHRTYGTKGRESLRDLTVLCRECHARHHDQSIEDIEFGAPHWDDLPAIRAHFERLISSETANTEAT